MTGFIPMIVEASGCDRDMQSVAAELEAVACECRAVGSGLVRHAATNSVLLRTDRRLVTVSVIADDRDAHLRIITSEINGGPESERQWSLKHDLGLLGWPMPPGTGDEEEIAAIFSHYAKVIPRGERMIDGPARDEAEKLRVHVAGIALAAIDAGIATPQDRSYALIHYGRREPGFCISRESDFESRPMGRELDDILAGIRPVHRIAVNVGQRSSDITVSPHRSYAEARHIREMTPIDRIRIMRDPRYAAIRFDAKETAA